MRIRLFCAALIAVAGCHSERTYELKAVGQSPNLKGTLTHSVRLRLDTAQRTVVWVDDMKDSAGRADRSMSTWGKDPFPSCAFLDEKNWKCGTTPRDDYVLEMRDGVLYRGLYGVVDTFTTK